ncbi:MAG TPA: sodium-dependent phosphate transporter, partial [Firmicutes bacterium]|nr:sodium-dependent phosphate transporter [Bacillota bacterium]
MKELIFGVVGGLALFIYGMNLMSEGLKKVAGDRLRKILEVVTKNPFIGVIVGAIVTTVIQSSSATTVMVIGFVNAGLMNLQQGIGIIMGANIGTTVTAQLIAFQ